jgi:hypothetical protein
LASNVVNIGEVGERSQPQLSDAPLPAGQSGSWDQKPEDNSECLPWHRFQIRNIDCLVVG